LDACGKQQEGVPEFAVCVSLMEVDIDANTKMKKANLIAIHQQLLEMGLA